MRKHTIERLAQEIADLYYSYHDSTLKAIVAILRNYGFVVIREYEIDMGDYNGRSDVYAYNGMTIGLEFESALTPRYKSIDKLEELNPDVAILVVGKGTFDDQYKKRKYILNIGSPYLYLVSLIDSTFWSRRELE